MARTSLMTSIFFSPAATSMTVNSVFSFSRSSGGSGRTGYRNGGRRADTPHFSSRSFASSAGFEHGEAREVVNNLL